MHHGAALAAVVFLLPLVHLSDQLEERALGHRRVPVHGPPQELKLLHHPVAILRLEYARKKDRKKIGKPPSQVRLAHSGNARLGGCLIIAKSQTVKMQGAG